MPYRISRLGTVEIRSLDLDRDLDYYVNVLGLQLTAREGRTAYLKGWDERHAYSVMLTGVGRLFGVGVLNVYDTSSALATTIRSAVLFSSCTPALNA